VRGAVDHQVSGFGVIRPGEAVFSSSWDFLQEEELVGSLPGIAAALCGALLLGTGHAYTQRSDCVPDSSTLRRRSIGLGRSQPGLSFHRQTVAPVAQWLTRGDPADHEAAPLSWLTPVLQILWPLRH
jgi:hypothetical protein